MSPLRDQKYYLNQNNVLSWTTTLVSTRTSSQWHSRCCAHKCSLEALLWNLEALLWNAKWGTLLPLIYTEVKLGDILVVLSNDPRSKTKKWGNPDFTYLYNLYTWNSQIVTLRKYVAEGMILRINVTIHTNAYPPDYTIIRKRTIPLKNGRSLSKQIKGEHQGQETWELVCRSEKTLKWREGEYLA